MRIAVPADMDAPWLHYDTAERPFHEPLATKTYIERLDPGDVFWDLGSRYGYESAIAAELVGPENVHVFEAVEERLLQVERMNQYQFGGKITTNSTFVVGPDSDRSSDDGGTTILDEYASENGPPDFVKIDIEGYEADAVKSMQETVLTAHPELLIEVHPTKLKERSSGTEKEMIDFLMKEYDRCAYSKSFRREGQEWEEYRREQFDTDFQLYCA